MVAPLRNLVFKKRTNEAPKSAFESAIIKAFTLLFTTEKIVISDRTNRLTPPLSPNEFYGDYIV